MTTVVRRDRGAVSLHSVEAEVEVEGEVDVSCPLALSWLGSCRQAQPRDFVYLSMPPPTAHDSPSKKRLH